VILEPSKQTTTDRSKKRIFLFLEDTSHAGIIKVAIRLAAQKGDGNFLIVTTNRQVQDFFKDCPGQLLLREHLATGNRSLTRKADLSRLSMLGRNFNTLLDTPTFKEMLEPSEIDLLRRSATTIALQAFWTGEQDAAIRQFLQEQGTIDRIILCLSPGEDLATLSATAIIRAARALRLETCLMLPHEDTRGYRSSQFLNMFARVYAIEGSLGKKRGNIEIINNKFLNKIMHLIARKRPAGTIKNTINRYLARRLAQHFIQQ